MAAQELKIGLLGCGTVGRGLVELVTRNGSLIRRRAGVELSITKILVRDLDKERPGVDRNLLTTQPEFERMYGGVLRYDSSGSAELLSNAGGMCNPGASVSGRGGKLL
jgi:homoserine dehydrogenase